MQQVWRGVPKSDMASLELAITYYGDSALN